MILLTFASVNYVLFVTDTENLARLWRAVSELSRRKKVGAFNVLPASRG